MNDPTNTSLLLIASVDTTDGDKTAMANFELVGALAESGVIDSQSPIEMISSAADEDSPGLVYVDGPDGVSADSVRCLIEASHRKFNLPPPEWA